MASILAGIHTLEQHRCHLARQPEDYRPLRCPHCGKAGLWYHGVYTRKADRGSSENRVRNRVPIPRFFCPNNGCGRTCSVLPECIAPRRWYLWAVQEAALLYGLAGHSLAQASEQHPPCLSTLWRWLSRLKVRFSAHSFHLRNRFPVLGRHGSLRAFWRVCLSLLPLSGAMMLIHQCGEGVP